MNEYAGKWYSDLFGKPDEYSLILASLNEQERYEKKEDTGYVYINSITVKRNHELSVSLFFRISKQSLRLPVKLVADIDKPRHRMLQYLFELQGKLRSHTGLPINPKELWAFER